MSRTQHAADLCSLLVRDAYGELTSRIYTLLSRRGRQSLSGLVNQTRLTAREVRHGLAVLVQQNLVYHYLDRETDITHYEANQDAAYFLVRSGRILCLIQSKFGSVAQQLVENLLLLGHTKVADLSETFTAQRKTAVHVSNKGEKNNLISNGIKHHLDNKKPGYVDDVLTRLLAAGYIEVVTETMFRSPTDTYNDVEKEVTETQFHGGTKGTKQKEELRVRIAKELQSLRSDGKAWQPKRSATHSSNGVHINGSEKRRKLVNGYSSVDGTTQADELNSLGLDPNLVVRINYEKCTVALRNIQLVEIALQEIGEITSQVYAELLRLLEEKIPRCHLDPAINNSEDSSDGPTLTTLELSRALSKTIRISSGIGKVSEEKINTRGLEKRQTKRTRVTDSSEEPESSDEGEFGESHDDINQYGNIMEVVQDSDSHGDDLFEDPTAPKSKRSSKVTFQDKLPKPSKPTDRHDRALHVKNHLLLLAETGHHLVRRCGSRGMGEWTVDFDRVVEHMKKQEMDAYINQSFGPSGLRIVQILRSRGKLDEKQLHKISLMKQKDVRTKLAEMQMSGFVDIQEVPRDNNRTPNRTLFLWYFDVERVTMILLDILYKTMARHLQELEVEKYNHLDVLSLAQRSDVRGQEEQMLTQTQLRKLQEVREKETKLMAQVIRLDKLVGIFRDF